ncbi:MAG TPA: DUF4142 domain-containing protein [Polyangiaceae bacterium]
MNHSARLLVLPSLLTVALAGCGTDHPANSTDNPPAVPTSAVSTGAPAGSPDALGGSMEGMPTTAGAAEPPPPAPAATADTAPPADVLAPLSDDQIMRVVHGANAGEIEQAKLAQSRAKDARVKRLAAMMVKDHTEADAKAMSVEKMVSLTPAPSPTSTALESDALTATRVLRSQTGAEFDRGYVDTQVKEHQAVLDTLDQKLIPAARNPEVKAYLAEVRSKVAMHLQHAQELQSALQK